MEIFIPNSSCALPPPPPPTVTSSTAPLTPPATSATITTGDRFACKSISLRRLLTRSAVADVRREIQIMHRLTGHPNIVELRAAYEDQSVVHLVMEVCEGGELFERIIERKFYSKKRAAGICREIVTVVRDCHCFGVMHRDLKPENFLFLRKEEENSVEGDELWATHFRRISCFWSMVARIVTNS